MILANRTCPAVKSTVLFFAFLLFDLQGYAQPTPQVIDIVDAFEAALNANGDEVTFSNYQVQFNKLTARNLFTLLSSKYPGRVNPQGRFEITAALTFDNCVFDKAIDLEKFDMTRFSLVNCTVDNQRFIDCSIASLKIEGGKIINSIELTNNRLTSLEIKSNTIGYEVYLERDSVTGGDIFIENNTLTAGEIVISGIYSNGSTTIGNNHVSGILIENSQFNLPEYGEFNNYKLTENASSDLYLTGNNFYGDSTSHVYFNKGNYLNLDLRDNKFAVNVYFIENKAEERFFLVGNEFQKHVSFEKFLFSETWNELYWKQLSGYKIRFGEYAGESKADMENVVGFNNLVNIYKGLHTIFLSRGDLESANACYSEMKQIQGRRLKYQFVNDKTFGNFLRWQLNVLLKIYTNHGTDPGLAVVMSFFVILAFAVLYLFFPSEWDSDSLSRLLISYEQFLQRKKKKHITPFLVVLGSALLTLVNSVTLSINSFVTLGFGSIPTKGFARYLCIIEGFIGWFLLSIFTVALINQVLA